jgi:hypothetical protein
MKFDARTASEEGRRDTLLIIAGGGWLPQLVEVA